MGSSALLLAWKEPREVNGVLTGYRIYYQVSKSSSSVAVAAAINVVVVVGIITLPAQAGIGGSWNSCYTVVFKNW